MSETIQVHVKLANSSTLYPMHFIARPLVGETFLFDETTYVPPGLSREKQYRVFDIQHVVSNSTAQLVVWIEEI